MRTRKTVSTFSNLKRGVSRHALAAPLLGRYLMYDKNDLWLLIPMVVFTFALVLLAAVL